MTNNANHQPDDVSWRPLGGQPHFIDRNSPEAKAEAAQVARAYLESADEGTRMSWALQGWRTDGMPLSDEEYASALSLYSDTQKSDFDTSPMKSRWADHVTESGVFRGNYADEVTWIEEVEPYSNPSGLMPTEYKVLIRPKEFAEVSKGGIIFPVGEVEKEKFAMTEGTIIAVSHLAFSYATEAEWDGHKPSAGQRVIYGKYEGLRIKGPKDGVEYILLNDKAVLAVVEE